MKCLQRAMLSIVWEKSFKNPPRYSYFYESAKIAMLPVIPFSSRHPGATKGSIRDRQERRAVFFAIPDSRKRLPGRRCCRQRPYDMRFRGFRSLKMNGEPNRWLRGIGPLYAVALPCWDENVIAGGHRPFARLILEA